MADSGNNGDEAILIADITGCMGNMRLPDNNNVTSTATATATATAVPRPWDSVRDAGSPADPIPFPDRGYINRYPKGQRQNRITVYDEETRKYISVDNVLFRDYSGDYAESPEQAMGRVREAYWPIPNKTPITTIMGHVEVCFVLERSVETRSDDTSDSDSDSNSNSSEEEILFKLTSPRQRVAVKVNTYPKINFHFENKSAENPIQEIFAMQIIGNENPNVMGLVEVLRDRVGINVVMPFVESGELHAKLQIGKFNESEARYYFRQIINGVRFLHGKGICHRDLSPENILVDDQNRVVVVIDMGMAIRVPYTDPQINDADASASASASGVTDILQGTEKRLIKPQGQCGKHSYMSPEIYHDKTPFDGGAVDIWACGTILFCMVTGSASYWLPSKADKRYHWMTKNLSGLLQSWEINLTEECVDLMKNLLQTDPRLRYTMDEVLNHPWLKPN